MSTTHDSIHVPVLLAETLEALRASEGGRFLDCTLGGGGHSRAILEAHPQSQIAACDRDLDAVKRAEREFIGFGARFQSHHLSFTQLCDEFSEEFDGMMADLGVSTDQLKGDRGFSFSIDAPLDMRMDPTGSKTAADVVNEYSLEELTLVFKKGGVDTLAKPIARAIFRERPFTSTRHLAQVIADSIPRKGRKEHLHPATIPFQAIRMEVNDELGQLEGLMAAALSLVKENGRFAVITFHSIEDTLVTRLMRRWADGERMRGAPPKRGQSMSRADRVENGLPVGQMVSRKAVTPREDEVIANPNARSARLRAFEFAVSGEMRA